MISQLLMLLGVKLKPFNVPPELRGTHMHSGPQRKSLARARARWGEADLLVTLPNGGYRLAD